MMTKIIASYMSKLLHEMDQNKESTIKKMKKFQLSILELSNDEDQVKQQSDEDVLKYMMKIPRRVFKLILRVKR